MPLLASTQGTALRLYVPEVGLGYGANIASDFAEFGVARLGENRAAGIGDPSRKEREGAQRPRPPPPSLAKHPRRGQMIGEEGFPGRSRAYGHGCSGDGVIGC